MIAIKRTDCYNKDFLELVKQLDADLAIRDGADHAFYDAFNKVDHIKHVVVLYDHDEAISCGAIKEYSSKIMEIKRMYTIPGWRGKGLAGMVLKELEDWASELSFEKCILETGKKQPEAIRLYQKNGYNLVPNYGQYAGVENSVCFEKDLNNFASHSLL